jgi:hypothetical protein
MRYVKLANAKKAAEQIRMDIGRGDVEGSMPAS